MSKTPTVIQNQATRGDRQPAILKQDVAMSLANALMRLGKNDFESVKHHIHSAARNLELWLKSRPEKLESELQSESKKIANEWPGGYDLTSFTHGDSPVPDAQETATLSGENKK